MSAVPTPRTARTRPSTKTAAALLPQTAPSHAMATTQAARPAELTETELTSGVFVAVRVRPLEALPSKAQPQQQQQQQQPSQSHLMTRSYATTTEDENNTNEEGGMTSVPSSLSATTPETNNYNNSAPMSAPASLHAAHVSNRCVHLYPGNVVECEFTAGHGRSSLANTNQANVMQDDAVRARPVFSMSCHAVFDEGSTQAELMDIVGRRAVGRVLQGYHGTVLCYGQSGSGKTYTLLGPRGGVVDEKAVTRLNTSAAREHEGIDVCDVLQDDNNNNNNNNTNGVCEIGNKKNNNDDNDDDHHYQTSEVGQWQIREDVGLLVRMLHSLYTELPKQAHLTEGNADSNSNNSNNNTDNDTSANVKYEWRVTISAVELYNEKLRDLLPLEQTAAAAGQQQQQEVMAGGATMSSFASYSALSAKTATMAAREARQSIVTNTTDSTSLPPSMLGRLNRQQQQQQQQQQTQSGTTGATGQTRNERLDTASPDPPSPRVQSPHGDHHHHHSDRAHCVHGGNGTRSQTRTVTKKKTNNNTNTTTSSINKCDKFCSEVQLRARSQGSAWLRRSSSRAAIGGGSGGGGGGENLSFAAGPRTSCLGLSTANGAAGVAQGAMSLARNEDVAVVGLQKHAAPSFAAALQLIRKMLYYRTVHATLLNQNSNRAHTLFFVEVEQKYTTHAKEREGDDEEREAAVSASNTNDEGAGRAASQQQEQQQRVLRGNVAAAGPTVRVRKAVLTLVDLAGSERVSQTGVEGVRLQEARKINLSLLCLGNVIRRITARHTTSTAASTADHTPFASSLQGPGVDHAASLARSLNEAQSHVRGKNAGPVHIPYRDSKLTQLLQNSFGGNTITFVLCTISAAHRNAQETLSTLQFATMVKQVKNTATINSVMAASLTPAMASQLLHELRATQHELARLQRALREKDAALATMALQLQQQQQVQQHLTQNAKASTHEPVRDAVPTAATHAVSSHAEKRQEDTKPTNTNTNSNTRRKEVMVVRQAGPSQAAERPGRHAAVKELSVEALALRRAETMQNHHNHCKGKSAEEDPVPPFCTTEQQQRQYESIHMSPTTHGVRPLRHKQQQQQQQQPQPTIAEAEANTVKGEGVQGSLARRQGGPGAKTQPTASQARPRVAPMQRRQHSNNTNNNTNKSSPPHGSNSRNIVKSLREQEKESKAKASKWNQLMSHIKTVLNKHGRTTA